MVLNAIRGLADGLAEKLGRGPFSSSSLEQAILSLADLDDGAASLHGAEALLTGHGGVMQVHPDLQGQVAVFANGLALVSAEGRANPEITSLLDRCRRRGFRIDQVREAGVAEIQAHYARSGKSGQEGSSSLELFQQIIRDAIREHINDIFVRTNAHTGVTTIKVQTRRRTILLRDLTEEQGKRLIRAAFEYGDAGDSIRYPGEDQSRTVTDPNRLFSLMTIRMYFSYPVGGEMLNIRLGYRDAAHVGDSLDSFGLTSTVVGELRALMMEGAGVFTIVAATNNGKSTLQHVWITELDRAFGGQLNIMQIADPVESTHDNIVSFDLPTTAGRDSGYRRLARMALRNNPDVIWLGEVRCEDSAAQAFLQAIAGKLVTTTMHCEEVCDIPARYKSFSLDDSVVFNPRSHRAWLAMRLLPEMCPHCAVPVGIASEGWPELRSIVARFATVLGPQVQTLHVAGNGCDHCLQGVAPTPGIRKVVPLAEFMRPNESILLALRDNRYRDARLEWLRTGQRSLRLQGWDMVREGRLSLIDYSRFIASPDRLLEDLEIERHLGILPTLREVAHGG